MSIISVLYFAFLFATLFFYYIAQAKQRWIILLAVSVWFFLQSSTIGLLGLTVFMILVAYGSTRYVVYLKQFPDSTRKAKRIITSAIIVEASILIAIQDNAFFIGNGNAISELLGSEFRFVAPSWLAPLGLSYFTLILIGYMLDVYWEKEQVQTNIGKLSLFVIFFPQMISGPITRYGQMREELFIAKKFDYDRFLLGIQRIIWGLFKKLVIADRIAMIIGPIYKDYTEYSGFYILIAILGYSIQVYADFSASMDIVIGSAQLFGITLPENFEAPFFAQNISEFWRKWHMTLGFWLKDYVLYPTLKSGFVRNIAKKAKKKFGKKAGKDIPTYMGMFLTWFLVGSWHGGTWHYILGCGLFFFVIIAGGLLCQPIFDKCIQGLRINRKSLLWRVFSSIRVFVMFAFCISFGRAGSLSTGWGMTKKVFTEFQLSSITEWNVLFPGSTSLRYMAGQVVVVVFGIILMLIVSHLEVTYNIRKLIASKPIVIRWMVWYALIVGVLVFGLYGSGYNPADFIYGGY